MLLIALIAAAGSFAIQSILLVLRMSAILADWLCAMGNTSPTNHSKSRINHR